MKAAILSASTVFGAAIALCLAIAMCLCPTAAAETTQTVTPVVHVVSTYSGALTIGGDVDANGVLDFGYLVASGEPATRTLSLNIAANAGWQVTVTSTQNLAVGGYEGTKYIPPDKFTFTSDGDPGPTYVTSDTPFRTSQHSHEQAVTVDAVTAGPPSEGFQVDVTYRLAVPIAQPEGYYSAGSHVYTLIVGE